MKYFLNEDERSASNGTCYHEFFRGEWDESTPVFWSPDSMNIHDDVMSLIGLDVLIKSVIENYAPYGKTIIRKDQWEKICEKAEKTGGDLLEAIREITPWVESNFKQHEVFTILGI